MTPLTFARVQWKHPKIEKPLEQGWVLKLSDVKTTMDYFLNRDTTLQNAFLDVSKVASEAARGFKRHLTNRLAYAAEEIALDNESWISAVSRIHHMRIDAILNNLPVYINCNGGWFHANKDVIEIESRVSSKWPTTESPRYIQWPNGTHWYCKVGANDVEVDGKMKWDTRAEAEIAYEKWANR